MKHQNIHWLILLASIHHKLSYRGQGNRSCLCKLQCFTKLASHFAAKHGFIRFPLQRWSSIALTRIRSHQVPCMYTAINSTITPHYFLAFSCSSRIAARALRLPPSFGPRGRSSTLVPLALAFLAALAAALLRCRREEMASRKSRRNCSAMRSSAAWSSLARSGSGSS